MDPYGVLGVTSGTPDTDIRKAYHKLAREHHPDKGGDAEKFKKVQEAYEILSDAQKRQNYDQFGNPDGPMGGGGGGGGFPGDIFSQMFGGAFGGSRGPTRRANRDHELHITLEEAYRGLTKHMRITLTKPCFSCRKPCGNCRGKGTVAMQMGPMMFQQGCQACGGAGGASTGCAECNFKSKKHENLNLDLRIPPGVEDGATLVAHGLGEQPVKPDEEPGDIIFHVRVGAHPELMRQGQDLVWSTRISFEDSVQGKKIRIPHFDGPMDIDTADWGVLDPREDYIIPAKGFRVGDKTGRLRVSFNVVYPNPKIKFTLSRSE
jgi:DnaJ-class molecular chaperone